MLRSPLTTFFFTATFLGLLIDLVAGWRYISPFVAAYIPLVSNETTYLLFIAIVVGLGILRSIFLITRWLAGKFSGMPERRAFSDLRGRIRLCRTLIEVYHQPSSLLLLTSERTEHRINTLFELRRLAVDLNALRIGTPTIDIDEWRASDDWIQFLVHLDGYVRYDDLQGARTTFPPSGN